MARPFTPEQRMSIQQVLDLLKKILECSDGLVLPDLFAERKVTLQAEVDGLQEMLDGGRINRQSSDSPGRQAETDMFGIHVNDTQDMFSLPGNLHLEDCTEGYFGSAWLVAAMLFHEKYHYDHHTGFFGGLVRPIFDLVIGGMGLWLNTLGGTTYRTHIYKEYTSYLWSYKMMGTLSFLLENVCSEKPDCLPCCEAHIPWQRDARDRQNPWSTYGE